MFGTRWMPGSRAGISMRANSILSKMSAQELDELVGYLPGKSRLIRAIEDLGNIDEPNRFMVGMLP